MNIFDEAVERCIKELTAYSIQINELEEQIKQNQGQQLALENSLHYVKQSVKNTMLWMGVILFLGITFLSKLMVLEYAVLVSSSLSGIYLCRCLYHGIKNRVRYKKRKKAVLEKLKDIEQQQNEKKEKVKNLKIEKEKLTQYMHTLESKKRIILSDLLEAHYPYRSKENSDVVLKKILKSDK